MGRIDGILDRIRTLNAITDEDDQRLHLKADLRLRRRARLVNDALLLAVGSAIFTTLLIPWRSSAPSSASATSRAGFLFIIALALMCSSLIMLAREVRIALTNSITVPECTRKAWWTAREAPWITSRSAMRCGRCHWGMTTHGPIAGSR